MWFAIYSARRQEEITKIRRADDDSDRLLGLVRDAKHPTDKDGNHRQFRYTPAGWYLAQLQPAGPLAFPYERSEEHTSELQSLMRISYAVFCLKKKINTNA